MLIQIPIRNRFIDMLNAISFVPSRGYKIFLNENGFICPVLSEDQTMNVVFKSTTMSSFEVENLLSLSIPDIESFKKFFKNLPSKEAVIEYDEHLNSIKHDAVKLSLNGMNVIPGNLNVKKPFIGGWYVAEITDVDSLHVMCSHNKMGDRIELNNRKINLYTWEMEVSVVDAEKQEVGEEFKALLDRSVMKTITKIHKKIGLGSMYIKIFKDPSVPLIQFRGDGVNYIAYCGKLYEGK